MLNPSQEIAKSAIRRALLKNKPIMLEAPAGFGKTHLLRDFLRTSPFDNTLVLTETNQALRVLQHTLSSDDLSGNVQFKTVCSALNYVLENTPEGYKLQRSVEPNWGNYDLVIVDEGSQLSSTRWGEVKSRAQRILVSGDSYQAPPVGEAISPVWAEPWERAILDIPMRNTTEIYDYCLKLRAVVGTTKKFPISFKHDKAEFKKQILNSLGSFENGSAVLLAFSERGKHLHAVKDYNDMIVQELFGCCGVPHAGERIVFKKPYIPFIKGEQSKEFGIMTNSLAKIESVSTAHFVFGKKQYIDAWQLVVSFEDWPDTKGVIYAPQNIEDFQHTAKALWAAKDVKVVEEFYRRFADIQPSYACNAYVCQGMSKDHVFVDYKDLSACTRDNLLLRQKLFYVMCSRARLSLYNHF